MIERNSSRWWHALGTLTASTLLVANPLLGAAAEMARTAAVGGGEGGQGGASTVNASTRSAAASAGDSISAAKREFDAIQASRDAALHGPKEMLPKFAMPELHTSPPAAPATPPRSAVVPDSNKSANWLVDAMEIERRRQNERRYSSSGRFDRTADGDSDSRETGDGSIGFQTGHDEDTRGRATDEREMGEARDRNDEREQEARPAVENPLTRFLGEWMTPQDYALLRPGLDESLADGVGPNGHSGSGMGDVNFGSLPIGMSGGEKAFGLPGADQPIVTPVVPRENPFLEAMELLTAAQPSVPMGSPSSTVHLPSPTPPAPIPPIQPVTAVPAPTKSQIPDFARPALENKYFKPLKRF